MAGSDMAISWRLGQIAFFRGQQRINLGGPYSFTSAWKGAGIGKSGSRSIWAPLSASTTSSSIGLHGQYEGVLQVSDDDQHWRDVQPLTAGSSSLDDLKLASPVRGRYVRVLMTRPGSPEGYILSEIEVFGRGGFIAKPRPVPTATVDGTLNLAGGAWKLQRAGYKGMQDSGEVLSTAGFSDDQWIVATVPGTVLTSYFNVGAIPDPNFGQNQAPSPIRSSYADFWYRTEFKAPPATPGKTMMLNLAGINWKADIYLNGAKLGHIDGGFLRWPVQHHQQAGPRQTQCARDPDPQERHAWQLQTKNASDYRQKRRGARCRQSHLPCFRWLGLDTHRPRTQHRSLGRDQPRPHRPGHSRRPAGRSHPCCRCPIQAMPTSQSSASLSPTTATNPSPAPSAASSVLIDFLERVTNSRQQRQASRSGSRPTLTSNSASRNPKLWWPVGYGEPHLYDVEAHHRRPRGETHDRKTFKAGIARQITSDETDGNLHLFVKLGRRLIAKGRQLGLCRSRCCVSEPANTMPLRPLPPRNELQYGPQLGRAGRRRRFL